MDPNLSLHPEDLFLVVGGWYALFEFEQRTVLFFDFITDAAGRLGDCVHKRCAEGLRGKHSIQHNLKL